MKDEHTHADRIGRWRIWRRCFGATVAFMLVTDPVPLSVRRCLFAAQPVPSTIQDPRPVGKAMAILARELGWNITYEDPPYRFADDLVDVTTNGKSRHRALVPRGGQVDLPQDLAAAAKRQSPLEVIDGILRTEQTPRGPVKRFKVIQSGEMFHVVPIRTLDATGRWHRVDSILDVELSISHGEMRLADFLDLLCTEIADATGASIRVGRVPTTLVFRVSLPGQRRQAPARTMLMDALAATGTRLSWLLMYDPSRAMYLLHVVPPGVF